nr:hypothetical protein [Tanacetum cinerariifolium]
MSAHDGRTKLLDNLAYNLVVGHPDADRFALHTAVARGVGAGLEDEDKAQIGLFGLNAFDAAEFLNGFGVVDIAANAIHRIGGVNNKPAFAQHFYYLKNAVLGRVFGVDAEQRGSHKVDTEGQKKSHRKLGGLHTAGKVLRIFKAGN